MPKLAALLLFTLIARGMGQEVGAPQPYAGPSGAFPFSMVGRTVFQQGLSWYQGSGTVIRPYAVLTAAHTLWDADSGFSTDLLFQRALAGTEAASQQYASRIYVLGGYREKARRFGPNDVRTFSEDLGAMLFAAPVAGGAHAGWWANPAVLMGAGGSLAMGYGAQIHDGSTLLAVAAPGGYAPVVGSFFASRALFFEEGMSGGPVFAADPAQNLYVAGVVVAGSPDLSAGGIRVLDPEAAAFIRNYLK